MTAATATREYPSATKTTVRSACCKETLTIDGRGWVCLNCDQIATGVTVPEDPATLRTPTLVHEYAMLHAFIDAGPRFAKAHARLSDVVEELRVRGVLDR